jgi:hypothetical protein
MKVYVIHWEYIDKSASDITGVFDDEDAANNVFDAMEAVADSRRIYMDTYQINQVKKEN